jgi:hypothetical protein
MPRAMLGLKEFEYLGAPQSGTLLERLANLRGRILERVEARRGVGRRDDPIPVRVKELRRACLDALARPETTPDEARSLRSDFDDCSRSCSSSAIRETTCGRARRSNVRPRR